MSHFAYMYIVHKRLYFQKQFNQEPLLALEHTILKFLELHYPDPLAFSLATRTSFLRHSCRENKGGKKGREGGRGGREGGEGGREGREGGREGREGREP